MRSNVFFVIPLSVFFAMQACGLQNWAAEPVPPAIAAPQAYCVTPQSDPVTPPQSCQVPFAAEGSACECRGTDGHKMSGKVRIILPPPNRPLG
jgi:hypothetical protein